MNHIVTKRVINIAIACLIGLAIACNAAPNPKLETPQQALVTRLVTEIKAVHGFSGIAYQDCDEEGNCILLVYVDRGYEGYSWTIYAHCTETHCEIQRGCD